MDERVHTFFKLDDGLQVNKLEDLRTKYSQAKEVLANYDNVLKEQTPGFSGVATVYIRLGGTMSKAIVDTGASRSFVSQDIFSNIKAEQRKGIKINENKISLVMKTPLGTVYLMILIPLKAK